jgi:ATP-binding cassette subfamily C protein
MADQVAALLGGLKFAAAHGLRTALTDRVTAESAALTRRRLGERRRHSRASVAASSAAALAGIALVGIGTAIGVSAVALLAGLAIVLRMSGPMRTLQSNVPQFAALMPAFAAVTALCETLERATEPVDTADGSTIAGLIEAHGIRFAHPGAAQPVLDGIDVDIAPGEIVGLAGPSGAGKTTLLDIVAGLRLPDAGYLRVAGVVLGTPQLPIWRRGIAYVTQDTYLFDDTLRRNLVWGADDIVGDPQVWAALQATGLRDLVEGLPDMLDTRVAERGLRFSGGQRQRLALARAILRAPQLLLLDEATSALDLTAERTVLAGVCEALPDTAIMLVSHRIEALAICDRLIILDDGRIVPVDSA